MPDFLDDLVLALTLQAIAMSVPGQNHFLILSTSEQKFVTRLLLVIGIASAGVVFSVGAIAAIYFSGQVLSDRMFSIFGILGSSYLLYLGTSSILQSRRAESEQIAWTKHLSPIHAFVSGFLVNLSNAKSVLFFGSIFTTTLPLAQMSPSALMLVVSAFYANSILVHGVVSVLFTTEPIRSITQTKRPLVLLISGVAFVIFALAFLSHILIV